MKPNFLEQKYSKTLDVLRQFSISVAFYNEFAIFSVRRKFQVAFSKNPSTFCSENAKYERFEKSYCFICILHQNLPLLANLEKFNFFSKNPFFFLRNPSFERFDNFYYFIRILQQVCYFQSFLENFKIFFGETYLLFLKKTQILNVLRNLAF